jgi:hypothetical protein
MAATTPTLPAIVASAAMQRDLRPRTDLGEPTWTFWEIRTLNLHRVVGLLRADRPFANAHDLDAEIRGVLSRDFKRAWWRGIAYGVVVDVRTIALNPDDLKGLVDVRENAQGDLQWVVLVASDVRVALGVHSWIEGYLSPVYRNTLQALLRTGYRVTSVKREKDGLMKFLTGVADVNAAIRSLGTTRVAFPEFREIATSSGSSPSPGTDPTTDH